MDGWVWIEFGYKAEWCSVYFQQKWRVRTNEDI